jgi:clan AA aspartic protease
VEITIRLPNPPAIRIEFVLDTGFEGDLTLPPAAVAALALPFRQDIIARLADGSPVRVDVYRATIVWDGADRNVTVLALGGRPLLGTALLDGSETCIQFADGGLVRIDPPSPVP